jgi:hypothetical protein
MNKRSCDNCGKGIQEKGEYVTVHTCLKGRPLFESIDFCVKCIDSIQEFIRREPKKTSRMVRS